MTSTFRNGHTAQDSEAPEVVATASDLIPVSNEHEGLEAVSQEHLQHQDDYSRAPSYSPGSFEHQDEKKGTYAGEDTDALPTATTSNSKRRRRLIWVIVGAILLVLAIGLGVGLGVGLSQSSDDDSGQHTTSA